MLKALNIIIVFWVKCVSVSTNGRVHQLLFRTYPHSRLLFHITIPELLNDASLCSLQLFSWQRPLWPNHPEQNYIATLPCSKAGACPIGTTARSHESLKYICQCQVLRSWYFHIALNIVSTKHCYVHLPSDNANLWFITVSWSLPPSCVVDTVSVPLIPGPQLSSLCNSSLVACTLSSST